MKYMETQGIYELIILYFTEVILNVSFSKGYA